VHYALRHGFVEHPLVPLLEAFGFGDLLIRRVTVEDVVVPFTGRAGPDVPSGVAGGGVGDERTYTLSDIHLQMLSELCDVRSSTHPNFLTYSK